MAQIGKATVEVGDYLRRTSDDYEGVVTAVDGDTVTLSMHIGPDWTGPVDKLKFNSWDRKASDG